MAELEKKPNCLQRFRFDFSLPFFEIEEGYYGTLDTQKNFNLSAGLKTLTAAAKFVFFVLSLSAVIYDIATYQFGAFFLAFLTRWTSITSTVYLLFSFLATVLPNERQFVMKTTWAFFSLVWDFGIIVALIYWLALWNPSWGIRYDNIMTHGGIFILVTIDGLVLNRTPVRVKHLIVGWIYAMLYVTWSVLQNTVFRFNPEFDDDDDAIYDIIKWREEPAKAVITFVVLAFIFLPFLHILLWCVSLPGRHYKKEAEDIESGKQYHSASVNENNSVSVY